MRLKSGSGLVDYVIPTAVVGIVVGLGVLALTHNNLLLNFLTHSGNAKYNNGKLAMSSQGAPDAVNKTMVLASANNNQFDWTILAGQLAGTQDNPAFKCAGDDCSIDYGSIALNGIPANYENFVETSGASGGTEKLIAMVDELIKQADNIDPPMDLELLKQLSNQGHSLAAAQKKTEETANKATGGINLLIMAQMQTLQKQQATTIGLNQQFQDTLAQFNQKYSNPASQTQANILNTVNVLGKNIVDTNQQYSSMVQSTASYGLQESKKIKALIGIQNYTEVKERTEDLLTAKFSFKTNINSTIICTTGKYKDTGKKCN